ncbi:MAG: MltA domain-containing protein [Rhizobiales bacterium]|nr:MltA domain-containing protein [Hyphomicrobiales bacterium]
MTPRLRAFFLHIALSFASTAAMHHAAAETREGPGGARLARVDLAALPAFASDEAAAAFAVYRASCARIVEQAPELRAGLAPTPSMVALCRAALALGDAGEAQARAFFLDNFSAWRVTPATGRGFLTGYYEPEVAASLTPSAAFPTPVLARPAGLETFAPGQTPAGLDPALAAALRRADGTLEAAPPRAEIERGALAGLTAPVAFLADPVEAFMIHVQGSARLKLADGRSARLVYDGRNGRPYASVGRVLASEAGIPPEELTLEKLKARIRAMGLGEGEAGLALLRRNESFIFFRLDMEAPPQAGPIGAQGLRIQPLRSIAVDRQLWPYGTPFALDAALPWERETPTPFRRLAIAQDTGSAIVGPARADLFFGAGEEAGRRAGDIRHAADFVVLLPREDMP